MSYDNLFWGDTTTPNHSQWRIKAESLLADRDIYHPTATKYFPLGAIAESRDGRRWRYCKNGSDNISKAMINQQAVGVANWQNELGTYGMYYISPAPAIGDKSVTVNLATTVAAHDLIDGYLLIETGTGEGEMYIIKDNEVGTANATSGYDVVIHIADTGGVRTAMAITSGGTFVTVTKNIYKDTIVFPTDPTGVCTGVNHTAVTAAYFYWAQVRGVCPILTAASTDTIVVGDMVSAGGVTAGAMSLMDMAAEGDTLIGYCVAAPTAASDYGLVNLTIE